MQKGRVWNSFWEQRLHRLMHPALNRQKVEDYIISNSNKHLIQNISL